MKKCLNISLFILAVVAAGVAFYNKQRQYERLKAEYNEVRTKYKKMLCEKYEPPSLIRKYLRRRKKKLRISFKRLPLRMQMSRLI